MISEGSFRISLDYSITLLKKMNLYKGIGKKPLGEYSPQFLKISRTNRHTIIHKTAIENLDYEILLSDDSIFQISKKENYLRYCFIQNPTCNFSRLEYIRTIYSDEDLIDIDEETLDNLITEVDENEYEQFLIEQELNLNSTIIRYDFDEKGYKPLLHSCSHVHIGLNENLRIPCSLIISPLKFVIFTIKQVYYDEWKEEFENNTDIIKYLEVAKKSCPKMAKNWDAIEENDIFLS